MMDLTSIINDSENNSTMSPEFNSCQLNLQNKDVSDLTWKDEEQSIQKVNQKNARKDMIKQMFLLLSQSDSQSVLDAMIKKYGSFFDNKLRAICLQVGDLIGNYFITCRYNDDLGSKNKSFVKYVLMCDCNQDCDENQSNLNGGSVDGFFDNNVYKVKKIRVCKKHNLPVLQSIDDLTEQDFFALAKQLSQVKNIPVKDVEKGTENKRVISKIVRAFKNIFPKKVHRSLN